MVFNKKWTQDPSLTLHDLLELHLQGLDGTGWIVSGPALYPVDRQPAFWNGGHIIILQEDHAVCVLNHCTVLMREASKTQHQTFDSWFTASAERSMFKYSPCIGCKVVLHGLLIHGEQAGVLACPREGAAALLIFSCQEKRKTRYSCSHKPINYTKGWELNSPEP